ncbi:MAG: TetR/AcrR family transcriptional regulator [Nitrospinota bacterium]|nr:TetR/AcrR family transcriptional regulator [Nitrospinota bacterium]
MNHRAKKAARTKLALLDAALGLITSRPFEEVAVAEICEKAEVSYATFFNYFEKKEYLLLYFIQLWSVEAAHVALKAGGGRAGIEALFEFTAQGCVSGPEIMEEIISFMARSRNLARLNIHPLSEIEKRIRFPYITDFDGLPESGLESLLPPLINHAKANGELLQGIDLGDVMLGLATLFLGLPVALSARRMQGLAEAYRRQLAILWNGFNTQSDRQSIGRISK